MNVYYEGDYNYEKLLLQIVENIFDVYNFNCIISLQHYYDTNIAIAPQTNVVNTLLK